MTSWVSPSPRRQGRLRDRHGRGMRGSAVLPGPLTPRGVPRSDTARDRFDALVLDVVASWRSAGRTSWAWWSSRSRRRRCCPTTGPPRPCRSRRWCAARRPADPAGALPPADRAARRDPGRPRRPRAHGARRAGLRAARTVRRRRSTRATSRTDPAPAGCLLGLHSVRITTTGLRCVVGTSTRGRPVTPVPVVTTAAWTSPLPASGSSTT